MMREGSQNWGTWAGGEGGRKSSIVLFHNLRETGTLEITMTCLGWRGEFLTHKA